MKDISNAVILITGGSSGMGLETARKLKQRGAKVIIASRNEEALRKAQAETGADVYLPLDVTCPDDWAKARTLVEKEFGRLDILLNNAGGGVAIKPFLQQTTDELRRGVDLNLMGAMYGCQAFAPMMIAQKSGLIINVLSVCAQHAWGEWSVYSAAKAGLQMFSKCLFNELQPHGVKVTNFVPAAASTGFRTNCNISDTPALLTGMDVADAIEFICTVNDHVFIEEMTVWGMDQAIDPR